MNEPEVTMSCGPIPGEHECLDCGDIYELTDLTAGLCQSCRWAEDGLCRGCGDEAHGSSCYCKACSREGYADITLHQLREEGLI